MTPEVIALYPPLSVPLKQGDTATIRHLEPSDAEALAAFYAAVPLEDFRFYAPHPLDREHALQNAAKAHSPHEVVLVLDDGHDIGGYAWYRWDGDAAEKSGFGICIGRPYQNAGAGRLLMTRLLDIARTVGPPVMCLTVQCANTRAVKLYTSMGFQVVREQMLRRGPDSPFADEPEYYMELTVR